MQNRPRIQIGISCRDLPHVLPGTYVKFSVAHGGTLHEKHVTETEIISQNPNCVFTTRLNLEYFFEEKQIITAEIFQCEKEDREESQLLGFVQCTVGRVIHSGGQLELPLLYDEEQRKVIERNASTTACSVIVCIREDPFSKDNINLKMQGFNLDKKDFFGKSDPYVIIYRRNERGKLQKTYRSEVIKNTLFPDFRPFLVCLDRLCGGNIECDLCFRCFDWDGAVGDSEEVDTELDDLIGEFSTTVKDLLQCDDNGIEFKLINPAKKKRKKYYQSSGQLNVRLFFAPSKNSFLDYIFGGTSINVVIAVDLSNHTTSGQLPPSRQAEMVQSCNEYGVAIQAVMEILQEYDSDQLFPAFGFGSRLSTGGKICHKYPLSGDADSYFCKGMAGVLEAYRRSFDAVHLSGPVCFSPIIRDVSDTAKRNKDAENYYVLLILTNGTVNDWVETKKAVIEASFLPVSIIVIGIGAGKFSDMEILDQDFGLLKVGQERACRDNVQFVQMRRFMRMAADGSDNLRWSKVGLAKEVLAELPSQMLDYFERTHLTPCHSAPGQPRVLQDLGDPTWWRAFTKPDVANSEINPASLVGASAQTTSSSSQPSQSDYTHSSPTTSRVPSTVTRTVSANQASANNQSTRFNPRPQTIGQVRNPSTCQPPSSTRESTSSTSQLDITVCSSPTRPDGGHPTTTAAAANTTTMSSNKRMNMIHRQMSLGPTAHSLLVGSRFQNATTISDPHTNYQRPSTSSEQ